MRDFGWKQVAWLFLLAVVVRLGAAIYWQQHWQGQFVFGDSRSYFELAEALAHGRSYQLPDGQQVFRTPGYPLLLAPLLRLFAGPQAVWAARIEGCLFGSLTAVAVAWWTKLLFGAAAACIAGLITAVYPEAVACSVPVLSEAPFCLLVALNLGIWTAAWRMEERDVGAPPAYAALLLYCLTGFLAAAAVLVRPSWMLFLPLAIACSFLDPARRRHLRASAATGRTRTAGILDRSASQGRASLPRSRFGLIYDMWFPTAVMLASFIATLLPWWVRNYHVTGHFVPTTLQVGASLYDGWNPQATGASDMRFVAEFEEQQRKSDAEQAAGPGFEYRLDRRLRRAAWDWAGNHPGRAARLAAIKFLRLWNIWPNEPSFSAWPVRLAVAAAYVPLLAAAAMGLWCSRSRMPSPGGFPLVLCWLPAVYFTLLHMVFVSSIRYRQPALLGLIVLAAGYLAHFLSVPSPAPHPEPPPFPSNA